jgi:hypothetical protein
MTSNAPHSTRPQRILAGVPQIATIGMLAAALSVTPTLAEPPANGLYQEPAVEAELFAPLLAPIAPLLTGPGTTTLISQIGEGNIATTHLVGSGSLSLIAQSGNSNSAVQSVEGQRSAALLVQGGSSNSVLQVIQGNDDFQLVGVSGQNNQVAYLQVGDQLAGALDVTGSNNSQVLAIQTNASGRYLMPTGLRGLDNQIVVIVPGRMYVLPRK